MHIYGLIFPCCPDAGSAAGGDPCAAARAGVGAGVSTIVDICPGGCGWADPARDCAAASIRELPRVRIVTPGVGDCECEPRPAAAADVRPRVVRFSSLPGGWYSWIFSVSEVVGGGRMMVCRCDCDGVCVRGCGTMGGECRSSFSPIDARRRCSLTCRSG